MKKPINDIILKVEEWDSEDLERLKSEIDSLLEGRPSYCGCGAEMGEYEKDHIGVCSECM